MYNTNINTLTPEQEKLLREFAEWSGWHKPIKDFIQYRNSLPELEHRAVYEVVFSTKYGSASEFLQWNENLQEFRTSGGESLSFVAGNYWDTPKEEVKIINYYKIGAGRN